MIIVLVPVLAQRLNSIHYHFNYARRAIPKQVSRTVIMVIKQKCKSNRFFSSSVVYKYQLSCAIGMVYNTSISRYEGLSTKFTSCINR